MKHHQRGRNGGNVHRHHDGCVLAEAQRKEVSRYDVHQVRYDERQAGGVSDKARCHHKRQRGAGSESQRQQHGNNDRRQN